MSLLKKVATSILIRMSGNSIVQKMLKKTVFICQYLMGIGSGSGVLREFKNTKIPFIVFWKFEIYDIATTDDMVC